MSETLGIIVTLFLLLANGFFVGAEFALVSARRAGIEPQADNGSRRAQTTLRAMENVSLMMAGAQLGITLCSLALGAVSEPAIAHLLEPVFTAVALPEGAVHPVSFVLALLLVTVLHVVIGEMVPKNMALAGPEPAALWLAPVLSAMVTVAKPLIWVLNRLANGVLRLVRVTPKDEVTSAFNRDEVAAMVDESHREGLLESSDRTLLGGALNFETATARAVALPLSRVHTLGPDPTPADVEALAARTGVTRFPIRSKRGVVGYVHLKDTLALPASEPVPGDRVRALPLVAADLPLAAAIDVMRSSQAHMARVGTEASTVGVLTLDDVLASLVRPAPTRSPHLR